MGCVWAVAPPQGGLGGLSRVGVAGEGLRWQGQPRESRRSRPPWGCGSIRVMLSIGASVGDGPPVAALPRSSCRRRVPCMCCSRRTQCGAWSTSTVTSMTSSTRPRASRETGSSPPSRFVCALPIRRGEGMGVRTGVGGAGPQAGPWAGLLLGVLPAVGSRSPLLSLSQMDHSHKTKVTL